MLKILIAGAAGRMGRELLRYGLTHKEVQIVGGTVSAHSPAQGQDIAQVLHLKEDVGILCSHDLEQSLLETDVVIDFTAPDYSMQIAQLCAQHARIHVCGTTGFSEEQLSQLHEYAQMTRILWSSNMSLGVNVMARVVQECAAKLGADFDIEVLEMHHRNKVDAPSGTAIMLGKAASKGRGVELEKHAVWERYGHTGPRQDGSIGFATLRGGGVVGEHTVMFTSAHEQISINHRAFGRQLFTPGAYKAALWLARQPAGCLYSMADVVERR